MVSSPPDTHSATHGAAGASVVVAPNGTAASCAVPGDAGSLSGAAELAGPATGVAPLAPRKRSMYDRIEAYISGLTSRSPFWHRVASMIWLPYAFRSGIRIKRESDNTFSAVLPFRKFNRNWYNAMAGASLLANSEIAGGMYLYGRCGGDYTVVCKRLEYKFLRPCFGPAIYRVLPRHDLDAMLATGGEFNFDMDLDVVQSIPTRGLGREVRVGKCMATFHVTPKALHEARAARRAAGKTVSVPDGADTATGVVPAVVPTPPGTHPVPSVPV
ncbi:MAG: hypothetical protein ACKVS8_01445 [Phycisphaerales bacterium]